CLWDVDTGRPKQQLTGHVKGVSSLAFATDGTKLVTASHDDTVRLWDLTTGTSIMEVVGGGGAPKNDPKGPRPDKGGVHSVALSPDRKRLAAGGFNGLIRVWDSTNGQLIHQWQALSRQIQSLAFSPDGGTLATAGFDHVIRL